MGDPRLGKNIGNQFCIVVTVLMDSFAIHLGIINFVYQ